jgi:hypothetical protein
LDQWLVADNIDKIQTCLNHPAVELLQLVQPEVVQQHPKQHMHHAFAFLCQLQVDEIVHMFSSVDLNAHGLIQAVEEEQLGP